MLLGDTGVVVRGYGTAVFMIPAAESSAGSGSKSLEHSINTGGSSQMNSAAAFFLPPQPLPGVSPDPLVAGSLEEFYSNKFGKFLTVFQFKLTSNAKFILALP